jgi:hypothetical protein
VSRDRLGAFQGFGARRVHLQVVDDTAVDQFGLGRGHSDDPAPALAIAAIPAIHAASRVRNSGPTMTSPSWPNSMPAADVCSDIGIAWIRLSVPKASHRSGRIACRHRAIPDLPELEPPLSTIT